MSDKSTPIGPPLPAATVVILRDGREGLEVFMVVRHQEIDFASGALVFPGGKVDPGDADAAWADLAPYTAAAPDRDLRGGGRARDLRGGGPGAGAAAGYASHAGCRRHAPPGRDLSRAAARGRDDLPRSRARRGPAARHRPDGALCPLDHAGAGGQALRHALSAGGGAGRPAGRARWGRIRRGLLDRAAAGLARRRGREPAPWCCRRR